jgi:hypothetical protein
VTSNTAAHDTTVNHSFTCTALAGIMDRHFKPEIGLIWNLRFELNSCQLWISFKNVICRQVIRQHFNCILLLLLL